MRQRRLKRLWKRLHEWQHPAPSRDHRLLTRGAAKQAAGRAYGLVPIRVPWKDRSVTPETFTFTLNRQKPRLTRRRAGHSLLRTHLVNDHPAQLWAYYMQLTEVELDQPYNLHKRHLLVRRGMPRGPSAYFTP